MTSRHDLSPTQNSLAFILSHRPPGAGHSLKMQFYMFIYVWPLRRKRDFAELYIPNTCSSFVFKHVVKSRVLVNCSFLVKIEMSRQLSVRMPAEVQICQNGASCDPSSGPWQQPVPCRGVSAAARNSFQSIFLPVWSPRWVKRSVYCCLMSCCLMSVMQHQCVCVGGNSASCRSVTFDPGILVCFCSTSVAVFLSMLDISHQVADMVSAWISQSRSIAVNKFTCRTQKRHHYCVAV